MNQFFKIFFASLLALLVFTVICFFFLVGVFSSLAAKESQVTGKNAVLVINLAENFPEVAVENPLAALTRDEPFNTPSMANVVRLIDHARGDSSIKAILLQCGGNGNGMGNSEDIRHALVRFRQSGKPVYAYADVISQGAYAVANMANHIYCNPQGGIDWRGYAMQYVFLKGALDRLEIKPQIFYAGKFKSATEPLRTTEMTEANRLQSTVILSDMYAHFLQQTSEWRQIDTATLHRYANEGLVHTAEEARKLGLVDDLKYEDEMENEIRKYLKLSSSASINWVPIGKYAEATSLVSYKGGRIAVIYAEGDIVDGKGDRKMIGSSTYRNLIRKARMDDGIKAIVLRINSGGGSTMASENLWRELSLAREHKPVVVSFGDVAASGAYYLSCNADSIFAQPNTITGSIGVFGIVPNLQDFFNHKLGVTFDGVKTGPDADAPSLVKPLTPAQQRYIQNMIDSIYQVFLLRVADGRSLSKDFVDSIGQGRIWSGTRAMQLKLVDRIGGLNDAIHCAAEMANLKSFRLSEFPEPQNLFDWLAGGYKNVAKSKMIKEELGPEAAQSLKALQRIREMAGSPQARLPYELSIQ